MCSVGWQNLRNTFLKHFFSQTKPPKHHVGIYDNCVDQNKSNIVFKFEVMQLILGFYMSKNKLFLIPGNSHNLSDVKTAELNKCLRNKNLYTVDQMKEELKAVKDTEVFVLESGDFYEWEDVLNKYIKDMPSGFTSFYCFELVGGKVAMKKFCNEAVEEDVMTKDLVENVDAVKSAILNEVFGLIGDATLTDIIIKYGNLMKL